MLLRYTNSLHRLFYRIYKRQTGSVLVSLGQHYEKLLTNVPAATSDEIEYTYTITNNGLLSLYDIGIEDDGLHEKEVFITCTDVDSLVVPGVGHGAVTGLAAYIDNKGLAPATSLTCSAKDSVTQEEVRRARGQSMVDTMPGCRSSYGRETGLSCVRMDMSLCRNVLQTGM